MEQRARPSRKKNGQGLLEFALVLPILLIVIFGLIDVGWIAFNFSQLYNGVREGARFGSVRGFGTTPQYLDCNTIADRIIAQAGFSGIKGLSSGNIKIYYDDGRAVDPTTVNAESSTNPASVIGTCTTGGSFLANTVYLAEGSSSAPAPRTPDPLTNEQIWNADRVVIVVDVPVPFLTPFLKSMAPNGVHFGFTTARSVFPAGLSE